MEISNNIRTYEFFLISSIGKKKHPAYKVLCFPAKGGCIRKIKLTEENTRFFISPGVLMPYLCEVLNDRGAWEYQLHLPEGVRIKTIKNFDEEAERIIKVYPDGMAFPDMFPGGMPDYEWTDDEE